MKKQINKLTYMAFAIVLLSSAQCKDKVKEPFLSVLPSVTDVVFSMDGASVQADDGSFIRPVFTVETNQKPWNVVSEKSWVKVYTSSTSDEFTLYVEPLAPNSSPPEPSEITVKAGNATPVRMTVQQLTDENLTPVTFVVTPSDRNVIFSLDGKTAMFDDHSLVTPTFKVVTRDSWNVEVSNQNWLTVEKEDNSFTLFATAGTGNTPSTATVTVSVDDKNTPPVNITVTQQEGIFDKMPVLACWGVIEPWQEIPERWAEMREAGFTIGLKDWFKNVGELNRVMDAAAKGGVKMLVQCPELKTAPETIVNRFMNHPATAGYFLTDEPYDSDFPWMGDLARKIQAIDNEHFCYANLFPYWKFMDQYQEHVHNYLQQVPVPLLSFDHYPIVNTYGYRELSSRWYQNLEIITSEAKQVGIPVWAYVLSTPFADYPYPTLADLQLQVYSNLAYGAQGIQYYTYNEYEGSHDGIAPIDVNGNRTDIYDLVKHMNKEISDLSDVFFGAEVLKVEHIARSAAGGSPSVPIATTRFDFNNRPDAFKSKITSFEFGLTACNAVVSYLQKGNKYYMVIINRNFPGLAANTSLQIEGPGLQRINKDGTTSSAPTGLQTLEACDMWIFGLGN